ncbi:DUF3592 domain-containing protein [Streptomyces sp. LaPpAH-108]|uniref:DUF3592 domain-containing protein n=1 Tax=Streptomyces sp. LaPpAH-108 TaxID=1155714 RepID=UPI00068425E8|nr:DUF3592 domain-containing protein [Streptomyces sp. LaPpAH-108]
MARGFIAFGVLFLGIGAAVAGVSVSYLASAERAQGTVVALEWRDGHSSGVSRHRRSSGPSAYPVVAFTTKDGERRTFRSDAGSNPPAYEEGERVEILYRADSPEDARINGFLSLWLLPLIFGGIGALFAGFGTVFALLLRKQARSMPS